MEAQEKKPSKEEVDALFKTLESNNQNNNPTNNITQMDQDNILDTEANDLLSSFKQLQEEIPSLQTNGLSNFIIDEKFNIQPSSNINLNSDIENMSSNLDNQNTQTDSQDISKQPDVEENDLSLVDLDLDEPMEDIQPQEPIIPSLDIEDEDFIDNTDNILDKDDDLPSLEDIFNSNSPLNNSSLEDNITDDILEDSPTNDISNISTEETSDERDLQTNLNIEDSIDTANFNNQEPLENFNLDNDVFNPDFSLDNEFNFDTGNDPVEQNLDLENIDTEFEPITDNQTEAMLPDFNMDNDFNFDSPIDNNADQPVDNTAQNDMDINLADFNSISDSFYSPTSFEQQIEQEAQTDLFDIGQTDDINEISEPDIKILKNNLDILPINLAMNIKRLFEQLDNEDKLIVQIREELEQEKLNLKKIEKLVSSQMKPTKKSYKLLLALGIMIVAGASYLGFYLTNQTANSLLQKGLDLINEGKIEQGNEIFLNNEPNTRWYNAYTTALIDQAAYRLAEIKLFGDQIKQKGILEKEPKNKEALVNLAKLFMKEGLYDKALSSEATFNGKPAKSLSYLQAAYPEDLMILDLVGQARMLWAQSTKDKNIKEKQLSLAYELYLGLNKKYPNHSMVLSRLLELSLISQNPKIKDQIRLLSKNNILDILETDTLAKVGLYYLDKDSVGEATVFFNTLKLRNNKNPKNTYTPLSYYFIGKFYLMAGDLKSAENNLILAVYNNTHKDAEGTITAVKNPTLQGHISNALGRIYMSFLSEYNGKTDFNQKSRDKYMKLAQYHLQESEKYNPQDPMNYYLMGDMEYTFQKDYPKAIEHFKQAMSLLKDENAPIPIDLSFNYGNSLYKMKDYNQAIEILADLRTDSPLYYPALEYLLGMSYLQTGVYSQAVDKINRATEFYQPELQRIQQKGYSTTLNEDKILYFGSVMNNNLGVIYQKEGDRLNNNAMKNQARSYFYNALEYSKRINPNTTLSYPNLNLQSSFYENNLNINNTPNLKGRETLLYNYTPDSIWELK